MQKNEINLNKNYFNNDAIIIKKIKSKKIKLIENEKELLEFDFKDFPILAIWSKKQANFLCIEPWMNTADNVNFDGVFEHKEGIIKLKAGDEFLAEYSVTFFDNL